MSNRTQVLLLAAATLLLYSVSLFNQFVVDDEVIIVNNPQTLSLRNLPDVWLAPDVIKPYYRPLNRATYLLDYRIAGMHPAWYHGVNIVIHLGNVLLLYLIARRLLPWDGAAFLAALIFGIHPVNSEAVNFVSARNTLLSLFFSLASLLAFLDARVKGKRIPIFSALLFFFGLLSKETAFMLIPAILLFAFFRLDNQEAGDDWRNRMVFLSPYLLVAIVYFAMRFYSLQGEAGIGIPAEGLLQRAALNYYLVPRYLGMLLFPVGLTLFHEVPRGGLLNIYWVIPVWLLILAMTWWIVRTRNRPATFGLAWFVLNYLPISNIVPIPSEQIAERYLYMPAVGLFLAFGAFLSWLQAQERAAKLLWAGAAAIVVAFGTLTIQRNLEWKDNISLFTSGVRTDPASPAAHYNLGTALMEKGELEAAAREWEKALAIDPAYSDALVQMGTLTAHGGDLAGAERYYLAALQAPPGRSDPDKSMAYYNLGKIYERQGQPQRALRHYEQFLKNVPITYLEYKPEVERRVEALRAAIPPAPAR
jgi:tetratricopeptide (TPR) repeat protein